MLHDLIIAAAEQDPTNNKDVLIAVLSFLGILVTGVVSYGVARYNARSATKASEEVAVTTTVADQTKADAANRQVDVNEWKTLVETLQTELTRLGKRVDDLEKKDEANRGRITTLEQQVADGDTKYRVALTYIRDMVTWTRALLKSHGVEDVPPAPPEQIANDLSHI